MTVDQKIKLIAIATQLSASAKANGVMANGKEWVMMNPEWLDEISAFFIEVAEQELKGSD